MFETCKGKNLRGGRTLRGSLKLFRNSTELKVLPGGEMKRGWISFPSKIGAFYVQEHSDQLHRCHTSRRVKHLHLARNTQPKATSLWPMLYYTWLWKISTPVKGPCSQEDEKILLSILTGGRSCSLGICTGLSHSLLSH